MLNFLKMFLFISVFKLLLTKIHTVI